MYTTDNVAAVAFGLDGESFTNPNASFRKFGDEIFKPTFWMGLKQQIILLMPFLNKFLQVSFVPKHVDKKFREIVNQVVDGREKARRDDLLQVILDLREKHGKGEYDEDTIVGHSMTFLVSFE
jgi:cytochrome P450 family 6